MFIMSEKEIKTVVIKCINLSENEYHEDLAAGDVPAWDSLGQINLIMTVILKKMSKQLTEKQ